MFHTEWSKELEKVKKDQEDELFNKILQKFPIQKRINKIFNDYLPILDKELHEFLNEINSEVSIFLQRWLRCVLIREFKFSNLVQIWDAILAYDMDKIINKYHYKPSLVFLDYISTYLIHKCRNEVLNADINIIYQKYLHINYQGNMNEMISSALLVKDLIKSKEDQKIINMSKSMKSSASAISASAVSARSSLNSSNKNDNESNVSPSTEIQIKNIKIIKSPPGSNKQICLKNPRTSEKEISLDFRLSLKSTASCQSDLSTNLNSDIKKLEHIYLKYKNNFSLKDSRDFLLILMKLKNVNK